MPQSLAALQKLLIAAEKQLAEAEAKLHSVTDRSEATQLVNVIVDLQHARDEIKVALTDGGEIKHDPQ